MSEVLKHCQRYASEPGDATTAYGRHKPEGLDTTHGAILYLEDITVSFDGFRALNKLNLDISVGELRCIIGPNGAGKTTMMDIITGKTRPDSGTVFFGSTIDLLRYTEPQIAQLETFTTTRTKLELRALLRAAMHGKGEHAAQGELPWKVEAQHPDQPGLEAQRLRQQPEPHEHGGEAQHDGHHGGAEGQAEKHGQEARHQRLEDRFRFVHCSFL